MIALVWGGNGPGATGEGLREELSMFKEDEHVRSHLVPRRVGAG